MWWGQGDELLDAEYFAETFQTLASGLGPGTDNTCIPARWLLAGSRRGRAAARRPVYVCAGSEPLTPAVMRPGARLWRSGAARGMPR